MDENNQNINGSNNNQININNKSGNVSINNNVNSNNVEYQPVKTKHFASIGHFLIQSFLKALIPFVSAGIAAVFAKIDFQKPYLSHIANVDNVIYYLWNLKTIDFHLFVIDIAILVFLAVFISMTLYTIYKGFCLLINKPFIGLLSSYMYSRNDNGAVSKAQYIGKCPVSTCSGMVYVKKPYPNEEKKNDYAGMCNRSALHTFNFDPVTLSGDRIQLTRKKEIKKETHHHYYNQ